jgi:hypothetical protein
MDISVSLEALEDTLSHADQRESYSVGKHGVNGECVLQVGQYGNSFWTTGIAASSKTLDLAGTCEPTLTITGSLELFSQGQPVQDPCKSAAGGPAPPDDLVAYFVSYEYHTSNGGINSRVGRRQGLLVHFADGSPAKRLGIFDPNGNGIGSTVAPNGDISVDGNMMLGLSSGDQMTITSSDEVLTQLDGDVDRDGMVCSNDRDRIVELNGASITATYARGPAYEPRADLDLDGVITILDATLFDLYFGSVPRCCPSGSIAECGDVDGDGIRDDACAWWACEEGLCVSMTRTVQEDIGGPNGECPLDGVCDGNDWFHALNCFSNTNTMGQVGYPCEENTPSAINVDSASLGRPCVIDGVCDANDAFAALDCFAMVASCPCGGPAPESPDAELPPPSGAANLILRSNPDSPKGQVWIDVFMDADADVLRAYQLVPVVSGGARGQLSLVDMFIDEHRSDYLFMEVAATPVFNLHSGKMFNLAHGPIAAFDQAYLVTLQYVLSDDADGQFSIDIDRGRDGRGAQTQIIRSRSSYLDVVQVTPAIVTIDATRERAARR